jgi:hypothetical protein
MEREKKFYEKPEVKVHGDLKEITLGAKGRISEGSLKRSS